MEYSPVFQRDLLPPSLEPKNEVANKKQTTSSVGCLVVVRNSLIDYTVACPTGLCSSKSALGEPRLQHRP
jgi:hypothetical protein